MPVCSCQATDVLSGQEAYSYRDHYLTYLDSTNYGWTRLWKCTECGAYWEMTWEGGGGFDDGIMTLRKLSLEEMQERWPEE